MALVPLSAAGVVSLSSEAETLPDSADFLRDAERNRQSTTDGKHEYSMCAGAASQLEAPDGGDETRFKMCEKNGKQGICRESDIRPGIIPEPSQLPSLRKICR